MNARGFTLVEMLVALGLLALLALAGLALVSTVLGVQRRTDGRLERLAAIERALWRVERDVTESSGPPLRAGPTILFRRAGGAGPRLTGYALFGRALVRVADGVPQAMLGQVDAADWTFHRRTGWSAAGGFAADPDPPDAAMLTLRLDPAAPPGGTVRRVIALAAAP